MVATLRASTPTYTSAASDTSFPIAMPTGWQPGDVVYIGIENRGTGAGVTTPAGWTAVAPVFNPVGQTNTCQVVLRRVMQAGDADPLAITVVSGRIAAISVAAVGADTAAPEDSVTPSEAAQSAATNSPVANSVTPNGADDLLLTFFGAGDPTTANVAMTFTAPAGMTLVAQASTAQVGATDAGLMIASLALTSNAATATQTATITPSSGAVACNSQAVTLVVKSAAVAAVAAATAQPAWLPTGPGMPGAAPFTQNPQEPGPPPPSYALASDSQPAGSSSFQKTITHDVAQGDTLVAFVSSNSQATAGNGFSDSAGNDWRQVAQDTNRSPNLTVFVAQNARPMASGTGTVTATFAGTATVKNMVVRGCPGMASVCAVDQLVMADLGSGTTPGVTTQSLYAPGEWALLGITDGTAGGAPSNWLGGFSPGPSIGPGPFLTVGDCFPQGTSPLVGTANIVASTWTAVIITLSPVQVSPPPLMTPYLLAGLPGLPGMPGGPPFMSWPPIIPGAPTGVVTATASGNLNISGTAIGAAPVTAAGNLDVSGVAAWQISAVAGSISISGTGPPGALIPAVSGSLNLAGTSAAAAPIALAGSLSLTGSALAVATAVASGSISLAGTGPPGDVVTAVSGSLNISGTSVAVARATASGSLSLSGTATAVAVAVASGSLVINGTAAWQISVVAGSLAITGTVTAKAAAAAVGSLAINGTAIGPGNNAAGSLSIVGTNITAQAAVSAAGTLAIAGVATARVAILASGILVITGSAQAGVQATAIATMAIVGSVMARANAVASGSLSIVGVAAAFAGVPDFHVKAVVLLDGLSAIVSIDGLSAGVQTDILSAEVTGG